MYEPTVGGFAIAALEQHFCLHPNGIFLLRLQSGRYEQLPTPGKPQHIFHGHTAGTIEQRKQLIDRIQ